MQTFFITFLSGAATGAVSLILFYMTRKRNLRTLKKQTKRLIATSRDEIEQERREGLARVKEEIHKRRTEFDLQLEKDRVELERIKNKSQTRVEHLDRREAMLDEQRADLRAKERDLARKLDNVSTDSIRLKTMYKDLVHKLERLSGMKRDEAKRLLVDSLKNEVNHDSLKWIAKVEQEARLTAKEKANRILTDCMQRYTSEQVTLHSSSVINLPNEEMKGRIIGKEGRNIKALEMATGMEFVIGDTPEVITISGFNPIRREIAKRALTKLVADGRINPTRIEEAVQHCEREIEANIKEIGEQTVLEFGFRGVHEEISRLLGMLHFRTSYTQNVLTHSKEVGYFARMIAAELGLDEALAGRCGLLHDIGKAVSAEVEGPHAIIGGDLAKKYGEEPTVVNAIAAHHEEVPPKTIYSLITIIADAVSASRPGARRETLSTYIKRLEQLEEISQQFPGVKKAYALQAGREIRVIVDETSMDDENAVMLARDLARRIEDEMNFPGQIKVNVIREKRIIEYAK